MSAGRPEDREGPVMTLVGPTAVGKTSVALVLAARLGGEIVSADSRQIYRGMDIGTAKPTPDEQSQARHHLIDIVDPSESYDAARFAEDAEGVISGLLSAGTVPIVCGGTGFYVASLFEGLFEGAGRYPEVRVALEERARAEGTAALHAELAEADPASAARIHSNDSSRVVRALEVYLATGRRLSEWHESGQRIPAFAPRYVGLSLDRELLRERVERRIDAMMEEGLVAEIEGLVSSGALASGMPAASAVGYRELLPVVERGEGDLDEAVALIKRNTRRYAKRQMTWFRSVDGVEWLDTEGASPDELANRVLGAA